MGIQGIFANGVALYNPSSGSGTVPGTTISGNNEYYLNAVFFEAQYGIDVAGGHPSPEGNTVNGQQGQYHYHDPMFLSSNAWNNTTFLNSNSYYSETNYNGDYFRNTDGHSKILGICFDGYPIYGPYAYTNSSDSTSTVILMQSSYLTYDTEFEGRPYTYEDNVDGYI
ncbi:MAG: YHYH protein, partial [Chryseobacterium sp.]